jgi:hypothetical protein
MSTSKYITFDLICSPKIKNLSYQLGRPLYTGNSMIDYISAYCTHLFKKGMLKVDSNGDLVPKNDDIESEVTYFTPVISAMRTDLPIDTQSRTKKLCHDFKPEKLADIDIFHVASKMHNKVVFVMLLGFRIDYLKLRKGTIFDLEDDIAAYKKIMEMALTMSRKKLTIQEIPISVNL